MKHCTHVVITVGKALNRNWNQPLEWVCDIYGYILSALLFLGVIGKTWIDALLSGQSMSQVAHLRGCMCLSRTRNRDRLGS